MTAAPTVTLATGEVVPSNSPQWRDECFARWERVVRMRPMSIFARRATLDEVQAKEGPEARRRLGWSSRRTGKPAKERRHEARRGCFSGAG